MGLITDFFAALDHSGGFREGWKRVQHIRNGHPLNYGLRIDKLQSEKHPHTDDEYIYTVNIMECKDCGLIYHDAGLERRKKG